ncbi:hypothetical protein NCAS_0D00220 [Naumovozyma castellii]|uniref:Putative ER transporter 6TM N-terminal domain-containing protein n=1 Tax=Naumovozyma castellii TaxID=27288 RepID=G0VEY4_NAUCA|nr:hypothetical protein NCAS_0D00220 [Naumovozyma castellii CBS 4309]CCC69603.1 hypothetical protein NCAS_0D00220 [Naumovozyma castellii CBS 4309]
MARNVNQLKRKDLDISKGSYSGTSYLSLKGLNNRNLHSGRTSKVTSPQISTTSFSHLRLENLAKDKHWEILEDFDLEELRDGYFDAVFTKPERQHEVDMNDNDVAGLINNKNAVWNYRRIFCRSNMKDFYTRVFNERESLLKYWLAYFISIIICVIRPSGKWIGHRYRYFLPIAVLIHHPVRNVGVQLEMSIFSILGAVLGMGWSSLAWYISTATGPTASHQGGILFQSLVMALLWSTWLKSYIQRSLYFSLSFSIVVIFSHTVDLVHSKHDLKWKLFWDFGISYLFGILLSLLICVSVCPHSGNNELMGKFSTSIEKINDFLMQLIDKDAIDNDELSNDLQNEMIRSLNIDLSQEYREFLNQCALSKFDIETLRKLRNSLTTLSGPLRVLPLSSKLLDSEELDQLYKRLESNHTENDELDPLDTSQLDTGKSTPQIATPSSGWGRRRLTPLGTLGSNNDFYHNLLRNTFSKEVFNLILVMILVLGDISELLKISDNDLNTMEKLKCNTSKLKRRIYKLDVAYKEFTKSAFFTKDLLQDRDSVDIFLFVRCLRNSARTLVQMTDTCTVLIRGRHWRFFWPQYPLHRALHRLPKQCAIDQGAGNILNYFETKKDVDEIFEKIYNSYTSRHTYNKEKNDSSLPGFDETIDEKRKTPVVGMRAIDHSDFNFHTTTNPWRYKLWKVSTLLVGQEMKWTLKILFVMIFLCLPTWLEESFHWYQEYQCWWCPLIFYLLAHRRYSGQWNNMAKRIICGIIGIFWGWAANQARHFGSPYVICPFAGLLLIPFSINFLIYGNAKSSFTGLVCFTIIALEPYSKDPTHLNTAIIWKNTWTTGVALFIGILISIPINWIVWPFWAKSELRLSISSLLAHLSQSYQSVTDRYLYRDSNDEPTELTMDYAHIREVRLTQSIAAVSDLLMRAKHEPSFVEQFEPLKYEKLIKSCEFVLEKTIEARMSSTFFEVWDRDMDNETTRALLSLRRDSVASVIYVFYILSNCFRSRSKIPRYLPNCILSRKKLFDFIAKFETFNETTTTTVSENLLEKALLKKSIINNVTSSEAEEDLDKLHWTEIHGIAFARAFTDISEAIHNVVDCSRDLLGTDV